MLTFTNEDLYRVVEKNLGAEAAGEAKKTDYLPFPELEDKVKEEVEWLKAQKLVTETAKEKISGWIYEVETGKVKRVV